MRAMLTVLLALCLAAPAAAEPAGPDDMNRCLCVAALSRLLCKKSNEMAFVAKVGDGLYAYTVHYAAQEGHFTCAVTESAIHVRGETSPKILRTIPYTFDPQTTSGVFSLTQPDCPIGGQARCVGQKSAKQLTIEREDAFWRRPIPDILQDELRLGTFGNASEEGEAAPVPTASGTKPAGP